MSHTAYARAPCQHAPLASAAHRRAPSGMTAAPEYIPKHTHGHGPVHTDHARHARAQGESARIAQAAKRTETRPHATQGTLHRRRAGAQAGGEPCGDGGGRVNRSNRQRAAQLDTHAMRDTYIARAARRQRTAQVQRREGLIHLQCLTDRHPAFSTDAVACAPRTSSGSPMSNAGRK